MRLSKARKEIVTAVMKDSIFEAAGSVLEKHGVGGVTMDRVAASAGLAAGSLYNYFRNKDDLMQFVYSRLVDPFFRAIEAVSKSEMPAPEKLRKIFHASRDACIKHKAIIRFLAGEGHDARIEQDCRPQFLQVFTTIFEQGIHEGTFRPHNPAHSSRMLRGCLSELFELLKSGASDDEVNAFADLLTGASLGEISLIAAKVTKSAERIPQPSSL